ncbi:MAG: DUF2087 domain-containing protein [Propionibacteriaceae bacterium]|jgi:hypothetical protein|nr:DUF2087 domain-containing protein [Propionibacteriaceae bacterium]
MVHEFESVRIRKHPAAPELVARYLDAAGRLTVLPAKQNKRIVLLTWLAAQVLTAEEQVAEKTLNDRLAHFADDVAMLRRYLVDYQLLMRTPGGAQYTLAASHCHDTAKAGTES